MLGWILIPAVGLVCCIAVSVLSDLFSWWISPSDYRARIECARRLVAHYQRQKLRRDEASARQAAGRVARSDAEDQ